MIKGIAGVPIFQNLGQDDLAKLEKLAKPKRYPASTVVFFEGNRADAFYIVLSGSLKVFQTAKDGRVIVLSTMGPGEVFGEIAMLDGRPRSASVETIGASELLVMERKDFRNLAMLTPSILWGVLEGVCGHLRARNDAEFDAAFKATPYRVAKAILQLGDKHGKKQKNALHIPPTFGVKDVADMAATTIERVERVLEKLEDDGLVQIVEGDLVIPDPTALKRAIDYMGTQ